MKINKFDEGTPCISGIKKNEKFFVKFIFIQKDLFNENLK